MKIKIERAQILIFLIFLFVFFSCSFCFLYGDDLAASNGAYADLFNNIKVQYLHWNARVPALLLWCLLLHKSTNFLLIPLFNITIAFCFLYVLKKLYQISFNTKQPVSLEYCIFSACLIYYLIYTMGWLEVIQWKSGAIVYLLGITLGLMMIDRLFLQPHNEKVINNKQLTLNFFLGLILGCYNEIIALFIICIYVLFFLYQFYAVPLNRLFNKLQLSFLAGTFSGLIVILVAPGTWERKKKAAEIVSAYNESILYKLNFAFSHYFQWQIKLYLAIFVLFTVLFILLKCLFLKTMNKMEQKIIFNFSLFFMSLLVLSSFAYTYEGLIGGRVTFIYDVLLFVLFVQALFYLIPNKKAIYLFHDNDKKFKLAMVFLIVTLGYPLYQYYCSYSYYTHQIQLINLLKNKSNQDVIFYIREGNRFFVTNVGLSADLTQWTNKDFARYYGIKSVTAINQPKDKILTNLSQKVIVGAEHCVGSVDVINDVSAATASVIQGVLSVSGWLALSATTQNAEVPESVLFVLTDSKGQNVFISTRYHERPDVGIFFKNAKLNSSGYISSADVSALNGDYILGLAYTEGKFIKICPEFKVPRVFKRNTV